MAAKNLLARRRIRIKCAYQLPSGNMINGTTRNIGLNGGYIECQPLTGKSTNQPKKGESGLITLFVLSADNEPITIRARCRINNIYPDGIDIDAQFSYLNKADLAYLETALRGG